MTSYRATMDTVIAGRPTAEGAEVKGLSDERARGYVKAGLIREVKPDKPVKDEAKVDTSNEK